MFPLRSFNLNRFTSITSALRVLIPTGFKVAAVSCDLTSATILATLVAKRELL